MIDTDTIQRAYDSFVNLAIHYPWIAVPVGVLFLLTIVASAGKAIMEIIELVKLKLGSRGVIGLVVASVAISLVGTYVVRAINKPRPEITNLQHKVLSSDYSIGWKYPGHESGLVKYLVEVTNKVTGEKGEVRTPLTHFRVNQNGHLGIRVTAEWPNGDTATSKELNLELYSDSIKRITSTMSMAVGVHVDHSEGVFCFVDSANGQLEGFDIDLAKLIREELKRKYGLDTLDLKILSLPWEEVLDKPGTYEIDFSVASISITPEREKALLFSNPYWETNLAIVVDSETHRELGDSNSISVNKLVALRVGAHKSTTAETFVQSLMGQYPKLKYISFEDNQALFSAIGNAVIDGAVYDLYRSFAEVKSHPTWVAKKLDATGSRIHLTPERYGIALAPVNATLQREINKILVEHKETIKEMIGRRLAAGNT